MLKIRICGYKTFSNTTEKRNRFCTSEKTDESGRKRILYISALMMLHPEWILIKSEKRAKPPSRPPQKCQNNRHETQNCVL